MVNKVINYVNSRPRRVVSSVANSLISSIHIKVTVQCDLIKDKRSLLWGIVIATQGHEASSSVRDGPVLRRRTCHSPSHMCRLICESPLRPTSSAYL